MSLTEKLARKLFRLIGQYLRVRDAERFAEHPPCRSCVEKGQHCDYNAPGCPYCGL